VVTSRLLSDVLEASARALDGTETLEVLAGVVKVDELVDALEHAAAIAAEVEHEANRAANLAQTGVEPAYPPLVRLLARSLCEVPA